MSAELENKAHSPDQKNFLQRFENYTCEGFSLAILRLGIDNKVPAFTHQHEAYEFLIPITAMPGLINENAVYFGEPGVVYPVTSGRKHGIAHELTGVSNYNISISPERILGLYHSIHPEGNLTFNYEFPLSDKLHQLIKLFKEEALTLPQKSEKALCSISTLITIELIRSGTDDSLDLRHVPRSFHVSVNEAADYLLLNCCQKISLEELSRTYGLSKYHFIRKFTQVTGESPYSFLLRARISKAKLMLEFDTLSVTEIGIKCGFATTSHFSEYFKKKTGLTPAEYRNKGKKDKAN